nr:MAG TPA: hypothetical protein [Caudoviricetes sp.]
MLNCKYNVDCLVKVMMNLLVNQVLYIERIAA